MEPVPANVEGNCPLNVAAGRMFRKDAPGAEKVPKITAFLPNTGSAALVFRDGPGPASPLPGVEQWGYKPVLRNSPLQADDLLRLSASATARSMNASESAATRSTMASAVRRLSAIREAKLLPLAWRRADLPIVRCGVSVVGEGIEAAIRALQPGGMGIVAGRRRDGHQSDQSRRRARFWRDTPVF